MTNFSIQCMKSRWAAMIACLACSAAMNCGAAEMPTTPRRPVTETYHGVEVTEEYRWLEADNDAEVKAWIAAQNEFAEEVLQDLPNIAAIRHRVRDVLADESVSYGGVTPAGEQLIAFKRQPPKQQPFLIIFPSIDEIDAAKVLFDAEEFDDTGHTRIDWFVPSPDGKLVAISLSKAGTESGDVHLFDTTTGKQVHEVVPRVNGGTAGGDLAWAPDGSGFFYSRYPRGEERPAEDRDFYVQVYYHELGTDTATDRYEIGKDFPRIAEIQLGTDDRTGRVLATVQDGDGGEFAHFLRNAEGSWQKFSDFGDRTVMAIFGPEDDLFVVSRKEAPRGKILQVDGESLDVTAGKTVVPEGDDTIVTSFWGDSSLMFIGEQLHVIYQLGGPSEVRTFNAQGKRLTPPKTLSVASVGGFARLGDDCLLFRNESFTQPATWYCYDANKQTTRETSIKNEAAADFSDVTVRREMATSKDGTQVPLTILLPADFKAGQPGPCVTTGYGGYGISLAPRFRASDKLLLEQGVIYVIANLRGGGEFGDAWHLGGNLTKKQNVFDDFAGVLTHLITKEYTTSDQLGIIGGSNGGLLMGATLTQHPQLMKAVVSKVGIYDMLRVELSSNGAFNIPEFGTVQDQDQFQALHAYSPYHQVKDGEQYPATLMTTGENDPRVLPMQSRKMVARLQAANKADTKILLQTFADAGHGADASLDHRIKEQAEWLAFFFEQLGVEFQAP